MRIGRATIGKEVGCVARGIWHTAHWGAQVYLLYNTYLYQRYVFILVFMMGFMCFMNFFWGGRGDIVVSE